MGRKPWEVHPWSDGFPSSKASRAKQQQHPNDTRPLDERFSSNSHHIVRRWENKLFNFTVDIYAPNLLYGASTHRRRHINKIMIIHFYSLFHSVHSPLSSDSPRILPRYSWKSRASIPISTPTLSVDTSERSLPRLVYIHVMHRLCWILYYVDRAQLTPSTSSYTAHTYNNTESHTTYIL